MVVPLLNEPVYLKQRTEIQGGLTGGQGRDRERVACAAVRTGRILFAMEKCAQMYLSVPRCVPR